MSIPNWYVESFDQLQKKFVDCDHYEEVREDFPYSQSLFRMDYGYGLCGYKWSFCNIKVKDVTKKYAYVKHSLDNDEYLLMQKHCQCDYCLSNILNQIFGYYATQSTSNCMKVKIIAGPSFRKTRAYLKKNKLI